MLRKRARCIVTAVFMCLFFGACRGQSTESPQSSNPCPSKRSCSDCIRTAGCQWCSAPDFGKSRCFMPDVDGDGYCDEDDVTISSNVLVVYPSKPLTKGKGGGRVGWGSEKLSSMKETVSSDDLVQIKPQRVRLQLRMNEAQQIHFAYSQAEDYPVDLYYLMDLSYSMKDDKEKLSSLGELLANTMRNITSNFMLGFGSFVDKVVLPYVSTAPEMLRSPCDDCAPPYGYVHAMSLSKNSKYFAEAVRNAKVSGNLDNPEGGFDAIMQAIVCKSNIGWRDQARHLLVFSTDADYHYAGDGKLGGIIQPNDGLCHLDNSGTYTHSTLQDYPSISHINAKVQEHAINLIFAVTSDQVGVYETLSKHIEGASCGKLSSESSNVVELVKNQYNKITSTAEMTSNASKGVDIRFKSACLGTEDDLTVTNKCDGLKVGDTVYFTAEVTLKECPKDPKEWQQIFKIYPVGVSESLIVELEMICDCPCEHPGHKLYKETPDVCEGNGVLACGVCLCDPGHFGKNCECSAANNRFPEMERGCRPQNSATGPICSNRGTCECGMCQCSKLNGGKEISGPYCECDNFSCDLNNGEMCSGPDHGRCVCSKCVCDSKYTGAACECLLDQTPCISPKNGKICSGNGHCNCGKCTCSKDEDKQYSGNFCEKCPTCPGRCEEFKDCVLCEVHKRGPMLQDNLSQTKCGNCSLRPIIAGGNLEANETTGEHLCNFYDDENCLYSYVYLIDDEGQPKVRAQKVRECPPEITIPIILGVIALTVLAGLVLLALWKIITTVQDRREYARFEKERMNANWNTGDNPIYKEASTTFKNPTFEEK